MSLLLDGLEVNSLLYAQLIGQAPSTEAETREPVRGQLPVDAPVTPADYGTRNRNQTDSGVPPVHTTSHSAQHADN